tara:strand:+ start:2582 stop:2698 length:117 start_codon:yes stop_codon:yes gene_type:complete
MVDDDIDIFGADYLYPDKSIKIDKAKKLLEEEGIIQNL